MVGAVERAEEYCWIHRVLRGVCLPLEPVNVHDLYDNLTSKPDSVLLLIHHPHFQVDQIVAVGRNVRE